MENSNMEQMGKMSDNMGKPKNLNPEGWYFFALAAHRFGLSVKAVLDDLHNKEYLWVTEEAISKLLITNSQFPKLIYPWPHWTIKATNGQASPLAYHWNAWTARYILRSSQNNMNNAVIYDRARQRGFQLPDNKEIIQNILEEERNIQDHLAAVNRNFTTVLYRKAVVRAHNWGYTVSEILTALFGLYGGSGSNFTLMKSAHDDAKQVRSTLADHGISEEAELRNGRVLNKTAEEFMISAANLGFTMRQIRDEMFVHGYDIEEPTSSAALYRLLKKILPKAVEQEPGPEPEPELDTETELKGILLHVTECG